MKKIEEMKMKEKEMRKKIRMSLVKK